MFLLSSLRIRRYLTVKTLPRTSRKPIRSKTSMFNNLFFIGVAIALRISFVLEPVNMTNLRKSSLTLRAFFFSSRSSLLDQVASIS
jgi:hypothetical protein